MNYQVNSKWIAFRRPEEIFLCKFVRYFRRAGTDRISAGVTLHMRGRSDLNIVGPMEMTRDFVGISVGDTLANFDDLSAKIKQVEHDSSVQLYMMRDSQMIEDAKKNACQESQ